jgi:hypothetical protein
MSTELRPGNWEPVQPEPEQIPSDFFGEIWVLGFLGKLDYLSCLAESPDPCNGWRGAFTACFALSLTGSSLRHFKGYISI